MRKSDEKRLKALRNRIDFLILQRPQEGNSASLTQARAAWMDAARLLKMVAETEKLGRGAESEEEDPGTVAACPPHFWRTPSVGDDDVRCGVCDYRERLAALSAPAFEAYAGEEERRGRSGFREDLRAAIRDARSRDGRQQMPGI